MMQSLEIISVNIWQILISLCNLLLLFLILKKFLYKPVQNMLAQRQNAIDSQYAEAESAKSDALQMKDRWQDKMASAEDEADSIVREAVESADRRSAAILGETREKAERILRQAETDAELERQKAQAEIKEQIADVSVALSEKMLGREISADDHRALIDSFLSDIGE